MQTHSIGILAAALVVGGFLAAPVCAAAQKSDAEIVISVTGPAKPAVADAAVVSYGNGYRSSLSGQTIEYHSSHPDADVALIVRGESIAPSIAWETEPVPAPSAGFSQLIWLAGIECHGFSEETDTHAFKLLINGEPWFTFTNAKDATATHWKVAGKNGAELSFHALMTDKAGDLFGSMVLKLPADAFKPGEPLQLEVRGDNSGSADWYMTFQHSFTFAPQLRAEPALLRDGAQTSQVLRLSLDNLIEGRKLEVTTPNHPTVSTELKAGANILRLPMPAVAADTAWPVVFNVDGKLIESSKLPVAPVKKRDFYLLSYAHNDIGYTDLQPDVERKHWNNIDQAMQLIRQTRDYPADARYKWNLETIWALDSYLKKATPAQRDEFFADVRDGSIGLSALYANLLTGLAVPDEMSHFFDFARRLRSEYRIPMNTAVTSDVPGFSWGMASALAQSGVKYFATAPNAGDRIGFVQAWGDKPFYWASQSGQEKVLMWMAGASYSSFHEGTLSKLGDEKVMKLTRRLDAESYPYDIVQLPYTIGDNGPTDPTLSDFVRDWNQRYVTPHLIMATHEQMFEEFEKRYGSTLKVVGGDFTPYWEDGAVSTAAETALNRQSVDRLIQGEALWSMLSPSAYPVDDYNAAWRNIVFFDEHTWGAHNSTEEPDLPFVKKQWEIKRQFALDADQASRTLLTHALASSQPSPPQRIESKTAVDVYNTNSWPRTDVVFLDPTMSAAGDRVLDAAGRPVPSQRLSTGELAVLVEKIEPFSARRLIVSNGIAYGGRDDENSGTTVHGEVLENESIALSVDRQTGVIDNLKWKKRGVQLVDQARGPGLNQYLYVLGTDSGKTQPISNIKVRIKERGNLVSSLVVEGNAPGASHYTAEVRLIAGIDRVDLITNFDKTAVREKEGVHIAFPFSVPEGQLRYDVADGIVRPETDQLAGACKNFFSVESWTDISNAEYGVTWATPNAPLIEIGAINAERPWMKSIAPSSLIYSYVMNNYWHTNYKADQSGPVSFRYSLMPHAAFHAADAVKFGAEQRQPLIVAAARVAPPPRGSFMTLSTPEIMVSSMKPLANRRSWLVRLYNPSGQAQNAELRWSAPAVIRSSDVSGKSGDQIHGLRITSFDSLYLRVDEIAAKAARIKGSTSHAD